MDVVSARHNLHGAIAEAIALAAGHAGRWQWEDAENAESILSAFDAYLDARLAAG